MSEQTTRPTVTRAEFASLLGISTPTLLRLERAGQIPAPLKLGTLKRWLRADVERFLSMSAGEVQR